MVTGIAGGDSAAALTWLCRSCGKARIPDWLSKSQISEMAKDLDAQVEAFRTQPPYLGLDIPAKSRLTEINNDRQEHAFASA